MSFAAMLIACSSEPAKHTDPNPTAGQAGIAGGQAGGGSSGTGSLAGGGGSLAGSSSAGSGGANAPSCTDDEAPCNGGCVPIGSTANGCHALGRVDGTIGDIQTDATHVYFTASGRMRFQRIVKSSGVLESLPEETAHGLIALNSTHVFWTNFDSGGDDTVRSMPKGGGAVTEILAQTSSFGHIVANDSRVFVALDRALDAGEIVSVPVAGGALITHGVAGLTGPPRLALDASHVFWTSDIGLEPDHVSRSTHTGPEAEPLASYAGISGLLVMGGFVYFEQSAGYTNSIGDIVRVPVAGGTPETIVAGIQLENDMLFGFGNRLYWKEAGALRAATVGEQTPATVLTTSGRLDAIAVDDSGLYVGIGVAGRISHVVRIDG